jgi:hypothetical protein
MSQKRLYERALTIKIKADQLYEALRLNCPDPTIFDDALELCAMATMVSDKLRGGAR